MNLKYNFECVDMGNGEIIAVPVGEGAGNVHGVLKLNRAGKEIMDMLKENLETEEIINSLMKKYDNEQEAIQEYVNDVLKELTHYNLIGE